MMKYCHSSIALVGIVPALEASSLEQVHVPIPQNAYSRIDGHPREKNPYRVGKHHEQPDRERFEPFIPPIHQET